MNRAERGKRPPVEQLDVGAAAGRTAASSEVTEYRRFIGRRQPGVARDLVRLGLSDGVVVVRTRSSGGRGAWVHPTPRCVEEAARARAFGRAFRAAVKVPESKDLVAAALAVGSFQ